MDQQTEPLFRFMRIKEVVNVTGLGPSTIYWMGAEGLFPKPIKLGKGAAGWRSDEITAWQQARLAGG
jgi:prophage regulatory protein